MSHPIEADAARSERQQPVAEDRQPSHAGEGRLVENIVVFAIMFVLFAAALWVITFFDQTNVWPFAVCLILAFVAFFVPQGILGRSDTGSDLAAGNRRRSKPTSAAVDS